jgi:hypothetical protein
MKHNAVMVFCMMLVLAAPAIAQVAGSATMNGDSIHDFVAADDSQPGMVLAIDVVVRGAVKVPGTYRVRSTTTLAQLIDYAGGTTATAQLNAVQVVHDLRVDSTISEPRASYNLAEFRTTGNRAYNPLLYPNDTIIVSELPRAIPDDLKN